MRVIGSNGTLGTRDLKTGVSNEVVFRNFPAGKYNIEIRRKEYKDCNGWPLGPGSYSMDWLVVY